MITPAKVTTARSRISCNRHPMSGHEDTTSKTSGTNRMGIKTPLVGQGKYAHRLKAKNDR